MKKKETGDKISSDGEVSYVEPAETAAPDPGPTDADAAGGVSVADDAEFSEKEKAEISAAGNAAADLKDAAESESEKPAIRVAAKTPINPDVLAALARRMLLNVWIPFVVLSIVFAALGTALWVSLDDMGLGLSIVLVGIILPPGMFGIVYLLTPARAKKAPVAGEGKVIDAHFSDKITGCETINDLPGRNFEFDYSQILKACETKTYFMLFASQHSAIVVLKSGIYEGTEADLRNILKGKLDKKFKASNLKTA
jgi:hypothetical protein